MGAGKDLGRQPRRLVECATYSDRVRTASVTFKAFQGEAQSDLSIKAMHPVAEVGQPSETLVNGIHLPRVDMGEVEHLSWMINVERSSTGEVKQSVCVGFGL